MTRVAGLLLTGGASRRMGRDKAALAYPQGPSGPSQRGTGRSGPSERGTGPSGPSERGTGLSLADHAAAVLSSVCTPCLEVGPGRSPLPAIQEVPPGTGPLVALVAGADALRIDHAYVGPLVLLACDMPRVTAELLGLVAGADTPDSVVPEAGGRLQPLCARYSPEALATAAELVAGGEASMHALLDRIQYRRFAEADWSRAAPADAFSDLDTLADFERFRGD